MRTSHCLLRSQRHGATVVPTRTKANGNFSDAGLERLHNAFTQHKLRDESERRCWPGIAPECRYAS